FLKLTKKGNVIPVYKEINADLDTPVSAFLKIKKDDYAFLLESVEGQEKIARYSFLGSNPSLVFKSKGRDIEIAYPHKKYVKRFSTNLSPLDEIKQIMKDFRAVTVPGLPRFYGGLVGFIGYDTVRFFEKLPDKNPDDLKIADSILILTDTILIFDHVNHTIKIVSNVILPKPNRELSKEKKKRIYSAAIRKIETIERNFLEPVSGKEEEDKKEKRKYNLTSNFKAGEFQQLVNKAKDYIRKGDVIQVVLSQRFKLKVGPGHFEIYRSLRSLNPSPYMYFLKLKDIALIGSSPEMLVRCESGLIQTRPIAGTRPRGRTDKDDQRLEQELLKDKKERAEHLMLVDLGRNDLGRVSKTGSVEVNEFMRVEKYSHVMHLVSEVRGMLDRKRYDIYDVLRAAFPAGTVTGSPKIRAMEIIDELENIRRGPYAGCVGYFSFSHNMDTCIMIRTIVIHHGTAYIQAGAGIVADSVPKKEYWESVNKAKALIEAITKTETPRIARS
ncbi:MAG: anthranilate synthase component I, partial [Candidatus Omnitrophica bacterium]|nr:anthranilate synthase component I [Candidatus Omnitrophota bacterium]